MKVRRKVCYKILSNMEIKRSIVQGNSLSIECLNEISSTKTKLYSCQNDYNKVTPAMNFIIDVRVEKVDQMPEWIFLILLKTWLHLKWTPYFYYYPQDFMTFVYIADLY